MKNISVYFLKIRCPLIILASVMFIFIFGCSKKEYYVEKADNPVYKPNQVFQTFDDMATDRAEHLIGKFRMDTVFKGETDEFKRILLLRHWIKSVIPIEDYAAHYPGEGDVEQILDYALKGQGYDCGYFMWVQNAVMNSFGYVSRMLGAGPGEKDVNDGHHGINEIWSNTYQKWFLSDAKYDMHFEKNGIPLSALEVRSELLKNQGADILMVKGPDRITIERIEGLDWDKARFSKIYTWITWNAYNNRFTIWPERNATMLIMYEDDFYRNNTWYRGGKPAWVYANPHLIKLVQDEAQIYFTPNTVESKVEINDKNADITLTSDTPALKEYQMKTGAEGAWVKVDSAFSMELKENEYDMVFRAVNKAGVSGPEHRVFIGSRKI